MMGKIFKITLNTILGVLILIGVLVVFSFVPFPGNYKIFTVQSGSMEPAIHTGSLIFVKPMDEYKEEDIITKKTKEAKVTVTHRVVGKKEKNGEIFFETKGDANEGKDLELVTKEDIIGKAILAIPFLGYPVSYAKTTQGLILIIVIPAVIIIYDEMNKIKEEVRKKIDYRRRIKKRQQNEETTEEKI